ncbi:type II secretion system ATPase GspE [Enterobacter hormaechei]|uniref:type II secretion system ATPase GspE n=1 Tax=Enterobacter hormaechei TaxID=158836 RepID=UPI0007934034|nr:MULTISPECIES: type II secretion system ATPase GspE [Enterobacter]MBA7866701.1 type II secretion system ATPase GspE [Enterobacter hormaechei]MBT1925057.1 type II secretion system ATPase GspE [Enterobacter hormaechei subsp. hoffmannii]MBT1929811.1 type II secretion system ATPase GspE [Enterobacter hormaechei subsp. hoffmannii]MBT1953500.1 type II secretion system ATPase GspE [Enterobacter hormaechei subsp. hoffmannii]MBT1958093.1 type II secretion system ATPase GspE [Enterobacter hormaechei s
MDELSKTLSSSNYAKDNGVLFYNNDVYIRDDTPAHALLEVRRVLGRAFIPVTVTPEAFDEMLAKIWQQSSGVSQQLVDDMDADIDLMALTEEIPDNEDLLDNDENSPVIRLINAILGEAVKDGASDIHIETFERTLSIRFRVDGVLRPVLQPARKLAPLLVSRIKVMSKLDIAEKRLPQDGRISLRIGRKSIDVRVSTIPSQYGERVVMRLLDKSNLKPDINKLGLIDEELEKLKGLIDRPHGIILVTGPTGSGKSTTLYAILSALNGHERNILTVEDPIEYELEGVGQTQVNPRVDMTFARGLRAILRQDPDVVMIGEIRDGETAQIAVQASLTGHLVMSTLHTNSAAGAITRLRDMGLESFLIGSSLLGVIAQRLVRRLCTHCRTTSPLDANEKALFSFMDAPPKAIYRAVGCEHCRQSGYQGRAGIHEFLVVDSTMRRAIHEDKDEMSIETQLFKQAYSLRENGLLKVISGLTSLEEVMRVTAERGGDA